jgi:hypothetical protein
MPVRLVMTPGPNIIYPADMDTDSKLIWRFAAIGLLVSSLVFAYIQFFGFFDATLYTLVAAVCPPSLLCIPFSDVMREKGSSYAIWLLIGLTNAGLYAVVGSAYVGLRNKQIDPTTLN